jgi:hypothetical protein
LKHKRAAKIIILIMLLSILISCIPAYALEAKEDKITGQAILVVIDRIAWEDIIKTDLPNIKQIATKSAVGLMTTNPAASLPRTPENTYTTIGAGSKVNGTTVAGLAMNADEQYENGDAASAFTRSTGLPVKDNKIVHLGITGMREWNQTLKYDHEIGAIGTILHQNNKKTAVIGNSDIPSFKPGEKKYRRMAVNLAVDNSGLVDEGNISADTYMFNATSLAGVKTDYDFILKQFIQTKGKADLVVIETGDTSRISEKGMITAKETLQSEKEKALKEIDGFLDKLVTNIDLNKDLLMIIVPGPPTEAMEQGNFLTPLIIAGRDIKPGLVWSGSTKRKGLVANIDIASKVVNYFGLPGIVKGTGKEKDIRLYGQNIESRSSVKPLEEVTKLNSDAVFLYTSRYPLVKGYINTELAVLVMFVIAAIFRKDLCRYLIPPLLAFTIVPGVMLWANYLPHLSITVVGAEITAITIVLTGLLMFLNRKNTLTPFIVTTGLTMLMITADIFLGGPLAKTSPFSYDVMTGARFYGIGNEYMGVLVGCTIVFTALLSDKLTRYSAAVKIFTMAIFAIITYTIAAPHLGTEVGGTIAAVAGFGLISVKLLGLKINRYTAGLVLTTAFIVVAAFIAYDLTRAVEAQSHIGRTMTQISKNGFTEILNIMNRKSAMNFNIFVKSTWSWFYIISILSLFLVPKLFTDENNRFSEKYTWFKKFLPGFITASVFALLHNDSGIVTGATMAIYAVAPLLTGLVGEGKQEYKN